MTVRFFWVGLAACAVLAIGQPLTGQNVRAFQNQIRELDPEGEIVVRIDARETLAWVMVSDVWYTQQCYQKERLATAFRDMWRSHGGSNIVVVDTHDKTVADFKIFGSGWKIPGCD